MEKLVTRCGLSPGGGGGGVINLSRLMNKQWTYRPCGVEQDFQITVPTVARGEILSSSRCVRPVLISKSQEQLRRFKTCHDQAMLS